MRYNHQIILKIKLSLISIFLQYNQPKRIPKIYASEYHLTFKENISKATGSKLLVNICKIYNKLLNRILLNNYYVKIKIRIR